MKNIAAMTLGATLALGPTLGLAADRLPNFDPAPSCRSAAASSVMAGRTTENCLSDEKNARDLLEQSWNQFSASDKFHCDALQRAGGPPSYVELLSCLEMSRDARELAKNNGTPRQGSQNGTPPQTTGAGSKMRRLPQGSQ